MRNKLSIKKRLQLLKKPSLSQWALLPDNGDADDYTNIITSAKNIVDVQ